METEQDDRLDEWIDRQTLSELLFIEPKSVYYLMESDNTFPKPLSISKRIKRWNRQEVLEWRDNKIKDR
jgi:predicted DNA-binding transcriptional regulator AlpA